jgi:transposase
VLQPQAHHEALQQTRRVQETSDFWEKYAKRSGIEGTISQAVRVCDLRRSRYIGLVKSRLQFIATATAINLHRLFDWLMEDPCAETRTSAFARLAPDPSLLAVSWRF